jgi:hypothetical protein
MNKKEFLGGIITIDEWLSPLPVIGFLLFVYFISVGQLPWQLLPIFVLFKLDGIKINIFKLFSRE